MCIRDRYHIDGFRFDLMGVLDIETVNEARKALLKINPDIIMYGEGWTGGESTCLLYTSLFPRGPPIRLPKMRPKVAAAVQMVVAPFMFKSSSTGPKAPAVQMCIRDSLYADDCRGQILPLF